MDRHGLLVALLTLSCASREVPAEREPDVADAWFGIRGAKCDVVLPALGMAMSLRAGTVAPWRVVEEGPWCVVAPTGAGVGLRIDSMAARVSTDLALPALAFFVVGGAWSYTVFDRGEPVLALESHMGEALYLGDEVRAAGLLEIERTVLAATSERGRDVAALERFTNEVGMHDPGREAKVIEAQRHVDAGGEHAPDKTIARIPPGTWAALPPLGVVLVKAVELRDVAGEQVATYVIVDDMATLTLPVARAEAMGMRPIASREVVGKALALIDDGVEVDDEAYDATRTKAWLEALGSGDLMRIAKVFATLCELRSNRKLYQVEEGLLSTSREWLAEEIATARATQVDAIDADLRKRCD